MARAAIRGCWHDGILADRWFWGKSAAERSVSRGQELNPVMDFKFSHLIYFVAIAEEGSFQQAALRLHLSQPTLSRQIKVLESRFGVSLFLRSKTGTSLTPAGNAFLHRARSMIAARESLLCSMRPYAHHPQNQQPQPDSQSRPSAPMTKG